MRQRIEGFVWEEWVLDKIAWKHAVEPDEVEESFFNRTYKVRQAMADKYLFLRTFKCWPLSIYCLRLGRAIGKSTFSARHDQIRTAIFFQEVSDYAKIT